MCLPGTFGVLRRSQNSDAPNLSRSRYLRTVCGAKVFLNNHDCFTTCKKQVAATIGPTGIKQILTGGQMETGRFVRIAAVVLAMTFAASLASAQLNSGAQPITLNATLAESLSVNLSASTVNFTLTPGSAANAGSTNVTATTTWVL